MSKGNPAGYKQHRHSRSRDVGKTAAVLVGRRDVANFEWESMKHSLF